MPYSEDETRELLRALYSRAPAGRVLKSRLICPDDNVQQLFYLTKVVVSHSFEFRELCVCVANLYYGVCPRTQPRGDAAAVACAPLSRKIRGWGTWTPQWWKEREDDALLALRVLKDSTESREAAK